MEEEKKESSPSLLSLSLSLSTTKNALVYASSRASFCSCDLKNLPPSLATRSSGPWSLPPPPLPPALLLMLFAPSGEDGPAPLISRVGLFLFLSLLSVASMRGVRRF